MTSPRLRRSLGVLIALRRVLLLVPVPVPTGLHLLPAQASVSRSPAVAVRAATHATRARSSAIKYRSISKNNFLRLFLSRTARVGCVGLRVAYTATRLVLADTCRKVVIVRAELAGAIRAHPGAARSSANLERDAAIRT